MQTDGRTDMMTLILAFRNFANAPKSILKKKEMKTKEFIHPNIWTCFRVSARYRKVLYKTYS